MVGIFMLLNDCYPWWYVYSGCYCRWITLLEKCPSKKNRCFTSLITGLLPFFYKEKVCVHSHCVQVWVYSIEFLLNGNECITFFQKKRKKRRWIYHCSYLCSIHGGISWYFFTVTFIHLKKSKWKRGTHQLVQCTTLNCMQYIYISRYSSQQRSSTHGYQVDKI